MGRNRTTVRWLHRQLIKMRLSAVPFVLPLLVAQAVSPSMCGSPAIGLRVTTIAVEVGAHTLDSCKRLDLSSAHSALVGFAMALQARGATTAEGGRPAASMLPTVSRRR